MSYFRFSLAVRDLQRSGSRSCDGSWRSSALLRSTAAWDPVMGCWATGNCSMYFTARWESAVGGTQSNGLAGPSTWAKTAGWTCNWSGLLFLAPEAVDDFACGVGGGGDEESSANSRRPTRLVKSSSSSVTKWFSLPQRQLRQIFLLSSKQWVTLSLLLTINMTQLRDDDTADCVQTSSSVNRNRNTWDRRLNTGNRRLVHERFSVAKKKKNYSDAVQC